VANIVEQFMKASKAIRGINFLRVGIEDYTLTMGLLEGVIIVGIKSRQATEITDEATFMVNLININNSNELFDT
jgi:hypothetical protein